MSMVFVLVLLSLLLAGIAVWAFFWALRKNQFDDLDSPAYSILDDEDDLAPRARDQDDGGA